MRKDLRLVLDAASGFGIPLPSAAVAAQLYTAAQAMGHGRQDIAVMYQVLAEMAGQDDTYGRPCRPTTLQSPRSGRAVYAVDPWDGSPS